jgi:phosphoribosyl 1,2-cyclic phosphodiesterase
MLFSPHVAAGMKITVFGTRGSYPVCRPSVVRYGGNTTCLYLECGNDRIIIDGGSGVATLGKQLVDSGASGQLHLFLTHPHWDHVMGLPFFAPFYAPGFAVRVYGADSDNKTLESVLSTQHAERHFPVPFGSLTTSVETQRLAPGEGVQVGSVRIRSLQLNHPGMNLGYRFEGPSGTFVILTDLAPITGNVLGHGMVESAEGKARAFEQDYVSGLVEFLRGADLVYYDTNFTDDEIEGRFHWGHSTPTQALDVVSQLKDGPALILSHHDPNHSDDFMDALYAETRARGREQRVEVLIAREGESFDL